MAKIAVVGAGSWGTALAQTLALGGNEVCMWARKAEVAQGITKTHRNPRYLSGIMLAETISATDDLAACVDGAEVIVPGQIDSPADVVTQDVPEQPQEESVSQQTNETVVIFPDDDQPQGKHFAPED